jgi:hypothetical protein
VSRSSRVRARRLRLSSTQATPSLYLAGSSGVATPTISTTTNSSGTSVTTTPADQQGRLVQLDNLSSTPQVVSNTAVAPSSGDTTAQSSVVDSNGDVYVLGNATGNFGSDLNQGTQGVYLSQIRFAGNLQWTQLVSGTGSASAYSLALDPTGGVVVAGSTTSNLTTTGISNGNTDSFVASYDSSGDQNWLTQIPTLNTNQANAVTVDAQGNVTIGGSVTGTIGAGQTSSGGSDAYVATFNSRGTITSENQFGTVRQHDQVSALATTGSGNLVVASVQNGQGILSEYNGTDTSLRRPGRLILAICRTVRSAASLYRAIRSTSRARRRTASHGRRSGDSRQCQHRRRECLRLQCHRSGHERHGKLCVLCRQFRFESGQRRHGWTGRHGLSGRHDDRYFRRTDPQRRRRQQRVRGCDRIRRRRAMDAAIRRFGRAIHGQRGGHQPHRLQRAQ